MDFKGICNKIYNNLKDTTNINRPVIFCNVFIDNLSSDNLVPIKPPPKTAGGNNKKTPIFNGKSIGL